MPDPSHPRLILASKSPRRAQLLRDAGFAFDQADPPFNDPPAPNNHRNIPPTDLAADLARQKALSLRGHVEPGSVILAADTICVGDDGRLIGTPADRDDAKRMIQHFINNTHAVVTGVALLASDANEPTCFADDARVTLGQLNPVQLNEYLQSDLWQGKAGAYNLFDRQQVGWPLTVTGDPTTVVGLPMQKLVPALADSGILPVTI